jgi:hypothetical protein
MLELQDDYTSFFLLILGACALNYLVIFMYAASTGM